MISIRPAVSWCLNVLIKKHICYDITNLIFSILVTVCQYNWSLFEPYLFYFIDLKTNILRRVQSLHQMPEVHDTEKTERAWAGKTTHLLPERSHLQSCEWACVSPLDHRWRLLGPVVAVNTGECELESNTLDCIQMRVARFIPQKFIQQFSIGRHTLTRSLVWKIPT